MKKTFYFAVIKVRIERLDKEKLIPGSVFDNYEDAQRSYFALKKLWESDVISVLSAKILEKHIEL